MADRDDIVSFTNELLELDRYPDYGPMGLQFTGTDFVTKIATAVSVSKDVIERAYQCGADMLIVHHGMFWNNESRILDERVGGRLELLEKYNISLLAYHLALDAHETIGNNVLAAKALGLSKLKKFDIGWGGEYVRPMTAHAFLQQVQTKLETGAVRGFFHGPEDHPGPRGHEGQSLFMHQVHKVAVIVGGAYQYVVDAHRLGYDTFFTGEASEPALHLAQDLGMNAVFGGHHATEQLGVQELAKILSRKFRLKHDYLQIDNPV